MQPHGPLVRYSKLLARGILLIAVLAGTRWIDEFLAVDRCLDRGGRWDYTTGTCDFGPGATTLKARN